MFEKIMNIFEYSWPQLIHKSAAGDEKSIEYVHRITSERSKNRVSDEVEAGKPVTRGKVLSNMLPQWA